MRPHPENKKDAAHFDIRLTVLGTRGSIPVDFRGREIFGGATSCYMVQAGEDCVFLDAGSGLLAAPEKLARPPLIIITHLHMDHLMGLGMYPRLSQRGEKTRILIPVRGRQRAGRLLDGLFSPPLWPLRLEEYVGDVEIGPLRLPLRHGPMTIEGMPGNHPGGCVILRLRCGEKSLVYATDYEPDEPSFARLAVFARGTDLLLYDGQYGEEEYERKKGYGHSTAEKGMELMERCGAKRLLLIHHDPLSMDSTLLERERRIGRPDVRYAREGEVITL